MSDPLAAPPTMEDLQFASFGSDDELNVFSAPLPAQQPTASSKSSQPASSSSKTALSSSPLRFEYSGGDVEEGIDIPESDIGDADTDQLLAKDETRSNNSFWTFEYYQQFFEVDTMDVVRRLMGSMVPRPGANYLQTTIRPNPDLYGPLWVAITLVFTTGVCGNASNFIANLMNPDVPYHFSFKKVTLAATVIFCYWLLLPLALRLVFWWRQSRSNVTFLESICVYGYSLAVYIPINILWLVPVGWLQALLVIMGMVMSGSVLVLTFWPTIREDDKKVAFAFAAAIFLFHGLLALGFLLYFFVPVQEIPMGPTSTVSTTTTVLATTTSKAQ